MQAGEYRWPEILPGGKTVLVAVRLGSTDVRIVALALETGEQTDLELQGTYPRYSPTGHIVFARFEGVVSGNPRVVGSLFAVPFDHERVRVTGSPATMRENIAVYPNGGAFFDLSDDGTLFFVTAQEAASRSLVWVERDGTESFVSPSGRRGPYRSPRLSPDGTKIVYRSQEIGNNALWIYDIGRDTAARLGPAGYSPQWSFDGEEIYSTRIGLQCQRADFTGDVQELFNSPGTETLTSVSPDGKAVLFKSTWPGGPISDIWELPLEGEPIRKPILVTDAQEDHAKFSPNGRLLAYAATLPGQSYDEGQWDVSGREYPDGPPVRVSTNGGKELIWSRDGGELFYRSDDDWMMAATIETTPVLDAGIPQPLFSTTLPGERAAYTFGGGDTHFDIASDGRFLMLKETEMDWPPTKITVVLNRFEELKQRVPGSLT